jgi:outer membrane immunogenic protein
VEFRNHAEPRRTQVAARGTDRVAKNSVPCVLRRIEMKKIISGVIMFASLGFAAGAQAADLQYARRQPAPYTVNQPLNVYSWAGPYLGGNLGYEWGTVSNTGTKPNGVTGGIDAGYNWQTGNWVYGIEGDIQLSAADDTFAPYKFSNPWFGTARGRIGYAFNNILLYGTGGVAFGDLRGDTFGLSEDHVAAGWTAGLGAEFALTQNWSAKAEYLYVDLSSQRYNITGLPNGYSFGVARVGVNYHF